MSDNSLSDKSEFLKAAASKARACSGGTWSACLRKANSGESVCVNNIPMQSASLIKLYIMGAVYENYDALLSADNMLDGYLSDMITVSCNFSANYLIGLLGNGSTSKGMQAVNEYCQRHGYYDSSLGRLLLQSNTHGDNYTSASDCVKMLFNIYNGRLPHSDDMLKLLKRQKLTSKIPSGIPVGVPTANKTGELESVQNDAAIVFSDNPYILCVMAEDVGEESAVRSIAGLSESVYKYMSNNAQ